MGTNRARVPRNTRMMLWNFASWFAADKWKVVAEARRRNAALAFVSGSKKDVSALVRGDCIQVEEHKGRA